jgi:hypothetical protein
MKGLELFVTKPDSNKVNYNSHQKQGVKNSKKSVTSSEANKGVYDNENNANKRQ